MPYVQPLFRNLELRSVTLSNRIALAPMCQYSAKDGIANDWHLQHAGARAAGGAGLIMLEATNVSAIGRLTPGCIGIWNEAQQDALRRVADLVKRCGSVPGIQLGHAGRKACTEIPWEGGPGTRLEGGAISPDAGGWQVVGPSALAFRDGMQTPQELSTAEIAEIVQQFGDAARRARLAGFRVLEVHAAHGYLIHSFLSPLSNIRGDAYGGSAAHRRRFMMEVIDAVRSEWTAELPLFVRISCSEYVDGGLKIEDAIDLAHHLKSRGDVDLIDCSSGGGSPLQRIPSIHAGYQIGYAEKIRMETGIPTGAVGLITSPNLANEIIGNQRADLVLIGRAMIADPAWPRRAAIALKTELALPHPYASAVFS